MRNILLTVASFGIGLLVILISAEFLLRAMPVQTPLHSLATSDQNPVLKLKPNQDFIYSNDSVFSIVAAGRVNAAGFVHDDDYDPNGPGPLLGVIGDSYVEALMVDHEKTIQGRLSEKVRGNGRVYSFARSGAALSQYIAYASWVAEEYKPEAMVFVIVANDFDQSLDGFGSMPGMHVYARNQSGELSLVRREYAPNWKGKILLWMAGYSRVVAYLLYNLKIELAYYRLKQLDLVELFHSLIPARTSRDSGADNLTQRSTERARLNAGLDSIKAFFRDLPSASKLPSEKILFLLDGDRSEDVLTSQKGMDKNSFFAQMRNNFMAKAQQQGYRFIDMQPFFAERHQAKGTAFMFPTDGHWNADAHALAAEKVAKSDLFKETFGIE